MSLSDDSGDDSSSNESPPIKRKRNDTCGASSTTSYGSVVQSDEDQAETPMKYNSSNCFTLRKQSVEGNIRLSQSSLSENEQYDDIRQSFDDNDTDKEDYSMQPSQPSFQNNDTFYNSQHAEERKDDIIDNEIYSEKSKRMMSNMGFKPGKGLGKYEQGRAVPVEASTQKGRRGLGLKPSEVGEVPIDFTWTPDDSKPEAKEEVTWMPSPPEETLLGDQLDEWLLRGPKKLTIDDETDFVDPQILSGILKSKTIFDTLDDQDLRHARFRSNPYETIGSVIFLNRAAVKMANLDAVFDFMFTKPKKQNGESAMGKKEILYFADVCAGPGGFSEYVLYRRGWRAKGFGFTLKGANDFKLSDFYAGTPETFNPYYGVKEDGNVFDPENLASLKENVLKHTDDKGVHFLMADGGFSVEGQENIQEILSKQLYLCQCLAALMLVRTGGHFVVKLFDVFTLFSVGLIYIMYRCFEKVCIHKPVTSRPANSERYLICMWKKCGTESSERHLFNVNVELCKSTSVGEDISQLVPLSVLQQDREFYEYIYKSNWVLGEKQIKNLLKIAAFSKDRNLKEKSQSIMREQCLKLWMLPDKVRTQPEKMNPDDTLLKILELMAKPPPESGTAHSFKANVLGEPPEYLEKSLDLTKFKNVYDWYFMILNSEKNSPDLRFFLSCGGEHVYQLEGIKWKNVVDLHITMPSKTLIYGEIVKEYQGQGSRQYFNKALHVIDAMVLGGVDISNLPLSERINQCEMFCTAVEKPFDKRAMPIRCKRLCNMEQFTKAIDNLEYRAMKNIKKALTIKTPNRNRDESFYVVGSLLFLKEIKEPWMANISKSYGRKYYFYKDLPSRFEIPEEAKLDMVSTFTRRILWPWEPSPILVFEGQSQGRLSKTDVEQYIQNCLR